MPEMACVRVPPCPIQKLFWWSFSVTRIGSTAVSPITRGLSTPSAASSKAGVGEDAADAYQPDVGFDDHEGMHESPGWISFVQPPLGDLPNSPRQSMDLIFKASSLEMALSM